jgi:hypothetical protein
MMLPPPEVCQQMLAFHTLLGPPSDQRRRARRAVQIADRARIDME